MSFGRRYATVAILFHLLAVQKLVISQETCLGAFDIYFVLDKSGSVSETNFRDQTANFVEQIVQNFVSPRVRLSFIAFSIPALTENLLHLTSDKSKIKKGLKALRQVTTTGDTYLGSALTMTNNQIINLGHQSASIIIILTDGRIHDIGRANEECKRARRYGAVVYVIGIASYRKSELELLSNKPSEEFVFTEPTYETLKGLSRTITNRSCVEISSAEPEETCLGEIYNVSITGRGFTKGSASDEFRGVLCGFSWNDTHRHVTKASLFEAKRLVCPSPLFNDTERKVTLQVSLNEGKTFVSSNVAISVKNCTVVPTKSDKGVVNGSDNRVVDGSDKRTSKSNAGLVVALLFFIAFLLFLALWWFWPRISRKPPRNYQPAKVAEPTPQVQNTGPGKSKWPTVDASYYGGGGVGGIAPVRVDWGDKGSTEAGSKLAKAKGASTRNDPRESRTGRGVTSGASSPGCWTVTKNKVLACFAAIPMVYRRLASYRPQPGGHWLYSPNPTV